jgi:hypothetical protein
MHEMWILQLIITGFLILSLIQPFIKGLWAIPGIVWLPLLALIITIGIFFVYGFRPECILLLIFEIMLIVFNIPFMIYSFTAHPGENFPERSVFFTIPALFLLVIAVFTAFFFSPALDSRLLTGEIDMIPLRDEDRDRDYTLRIYGPAAGPLIFLVPPEAGGVKAVDRVCRGLSKQGFTVVSYSRKGFDFPYTDPEGKTYPLAPAKIAALWQVFRSGTRSPRANVYGKALEQGRREDLDFLLPAVLSMKQDGVILAGYGAGGAALAYFAGSADFSRQYSGIKGIILVESFFWTSWNPVSGEAGERRVLPVPDKANWFARIWTQVKNRFGGPKSPKIILSGALPRPQTPVLYLVSDRYLAENPKNNAFDAVKAGFNKAAAPSALLALEGAGPLDYTDYPVVYPLYSVLFRGTSGANRRSAASRGNGKLSGAEKLESTVRIIAGFSNLVLENGRVTDRASAPDAPLASIEALVHIETRSWIFRDFRSILSP